ncbi:MAG: hypothetical protein KF810_14240 [Rhizobiaceae bacterium]|nr:hypothetical protein [Rhizobiaceae bacterium]
MERAARYVLGLMDHDERERAERDLEVDPAFRDAMLTVAKRMQVFGSNRQTDAVASAARHDPWRQIKDRIDAMPQMRPVEPSAALRPGTQPVFAEDRQKRDIPERQATFGRRKSDFYKMPVSLPEQEVTRVGLHSAPGRTALALAIALIAAFALGYVAGISSADRTPIATSPN